MARARATHSPNPIGTGAEEVVGVWTSFLNEMRRCLTAAAPGKRLTAKRRKVTSQRGYCRAQFESASARSITSMSVRSG